MRGEFWDIERRGDGADDEKIGIHPCRSQGLHGASDAKVAQRP